MQEDELTIAQASQALGVSKDTIRRRIKAGEIRAEKRPSAYGDQYYIRSIELTEAVKSVDVVKMEQTMTPDQLQGLFKQAVQDAMQDAIAPLHKEISALKADLAEAQAQLRDELNERDRGSEERDREVMERIRVLQEWQQRSLWRKLFG